MPELRPTPSSSSVRSTKVTSAPALRAHAAALTPPKPAPTTTTLGMKRPQRTLWHRYNLRLGNTRCVAKRGGVRQADQTMGRQADQGQGRSQVRPGQGPLLR